MGSPTNRPSYDERTGIYYTRITVAPHTRQYFALGKNEAEALAIFHELHARNARGELAPGGKTTSVTKDDGNPDIAVRALAHRHLEWVEANIPKTYATRRNYVRQFLGFLNERYPELYWVSEISLALVDEYYTWAKRRIAARSSGGSEPSPNCGNEHLRHVKTMLRWGWDRELGPMPRKLPKMTNGKTRTHAIGKENLVKLLSQPGMPGDFKDMIAFGLCLGLRPQELYPMRRDWLTDLDGDKPILRIEHHNTSDKSNVYIPRSIPLSDMAAAIARRQIGKHPDSDYVFLDGNGRPYRSAHAFRQRLQRWAKRAGIGHITSYELRHTFGTAAAAKTNLEVVRQVMGHSTIRTTSRYISNNEDYHIEAMRNVGDQMAELMDAARQDCDEDDVDVVAEAVAVKVPARVKASRVCSKVAD